MKIIADNGGGMTLQVVNADGRYQHQYSDMEQLAIDVKEILDGSDALLWDGNDCDGDGCGDTIEWLSPSLREVENGGYNRLEIALGDYHSVLDWGVDTSWANVASFTDCFASLVHGDHCD